MDCCNCENVKLDEKKVCAKCKLKLCSFCEERMYDHYEERMCEYCDIDYCQVCCQYLSEVVSRLQQKSIFEIKIKIEKFNLRLIMQYFSLAKILCYQVDIKFFTLYKQFVI